MKVDKNLILGIDDDPEIEALLSKILTGAGYTYQHCKTLAETEKFLKDHIPGIILLDIALGDDYGLDIYDKEENQRKLNKTTVIVLSAASTSQDVQLAVSMGVNDYIVKPVSKETLLEKIHKHLG